MTGIQQRLATGRGKFTTDYPELGTGPVNYEDSISEEFFVAERKAVFERNWLCVGRLERLPRKGSYFTRELPGRLASIVITRDLDDNVHAFTTCARTAATKWYGRNIRRRNPRAVAGRSHASTTDGATVLTASSTTSPTRQSSSTSTRASCACLRCTAKSGQGSSSSTSPRIRCRCAASSARSCSPWRLTRST